MQLMQLLRCVIRNREWVHGDVHEQLIALVVLL